ncbi:hypothetical protein PoB_003113600 [Plakobranchus ocellatus]|uniref:Uncharacterized protein n=1 Tax=Plakobranchus ocellatus TaxID=259542 RepID=A0AAV4A0A1_9GAST|nr:hypothetical protein PoB_003113600 [Plakobranchus ocellatus]
MFSIFLAQRETDGSTAYRSGHWISLLSGLLRKFHRNRLHKNFPNFFLPVAIMFRGPMISVVQVCRQHGDPKLSGPSSGQEASGGARTCNRRVPADLWADSLSTVPPTPLNIIMGLQSQ